MDFAVLHHINDPDGWATALDAEHSWPPGFRLRSFVEAEHHHLAICVWTAPGRDQLQHALDVNFGHVAVNELIPVEVHIMIGTGDDG